MTKLNQRNSWIDSLRSFITVLVVAHHSSLAYTTFAYFDRSTYINSTWPVVDNSRWIGMDIFENFNDIFFMSLMFFISGLFVLKSIQKKGRQKFLYGRFKRLGIPFVIAVCLVIPVAYLPSFYLINHHLNIPLFISDYLNHQRWPVGPPWFIWILLLFNIAAVIIPAKTYITLSNVATKTAGRPLLFCMLFFIIVSLSFIPLSLMVGQYKWTGLGPFDFQLNRILLYFTFFLTGACMGSGDWEKYFFTNNKLLNKSLLFWLSLSLGLYAAIEFISFFGLSIVKAGKLSETLAWFIFDLFFVASCIASGFALLSFFRKKVNEQGKILKSLSANAFGIYLLHFVFVTWLQFALLNTSIPVVLKFMIVFLGSLSLSWWLINCIRKYKLTRQII